VPEVDLKKMLADAAEEVLATMFFAMLDEPATLSGEALWTRVRVGFWGHATGALTLCATREATAEMTVNFLGLDSQPPPPEAEQKEVAKELTNMICGAVLSRMERTDMLHLLPPEVLPACDQIAPVPAGSQMVEQIFGVGAGVMHLRFQWDGAA